MKDEYLVPPMVIDIGNSLLAESTGINERSNYYRRIEVIKQYCERILAMSDKKASK